MDRNFDLNKFRTLIPISALYEDSLLYLASQSTLERLHAGDVVFNLGDEDTDSVFLLSGTVREKSADGDHHCDINANSEAALYALANFKPRQFSAEVVSERASLVRVDTQLLEKLLAWGQFAPDFPLIEKIRPAEAPNAADSEWMMAMLQTHAFLRLPAANIQSLFSRLEEITVKAQDRIIEYGARGDYFYMIKEGRCKVFRPVGESEQKLAELQRCDSFGEEALISDAPRNASVSMLTDGKLMRLSKADFAELLEEPLLNWVDTQTASDLINEGAIWVDTRLESEFKNAALPGAINIPLHRLRDQAASLDRMKRFVLYCDTGQRSSAAAFLLGQLGFDAYVLRGGIAQGKLPSNYL
ncbi:MAG: cyclic nucleotide-binding domain-containing protein [Gammaproteobacteria bacterium]|nr:cyclic nucleotide-binding domain-containing protein [Gammaproteobacteria bacterium]